LKKYLILALAVILALGMIGGAFAYFQDTETSSGNTFTAGSLDLKISDDDEFPPQDGINTTWSMDNMVPGVSNVGQRSVILINSGVTAGDHVEISFSHIIIDTPDVPSDTNPDSTPGEMAKWLEIESMSYFDTTFIGAHPTPGHTIIDANHNGFFDLEDVTLPENSLALDNLKVPGTLGHAQKTFVMTLMFNAGATNDIQGDTLITTVTFILNQNASQ
jgi:spore coat-associated protein N